MSKIILGIDPGSIITGFGVVRVVEGQRGSANNSGHNQLEHINHGVIVMKAGDPFAKRMIELGLGIREVMEKYKPQDVVIEKIFLGKNTDSAFKLGHARGVIMYEAGLGGAEVLEYATRSVKKGVTGSGGATKEDVQVVLQALLNIQKINRVDASDALAMACYHAFELKKQAVLQRAVSI